MKYILFDFDGVIANSFNAVFDINKDIHPHFTKEMYKKAFEGNINQWKPEHMTEEEVHAYHVSFTKKYHSILSHTVTIFDGMDNLIRSLSKTYTLIIISSSYSDAITACLKRYDLNTHFDLILGNDVHQSKVEKIKIVFEKYKTHHGECVFITDTVGDIKEAHHVHVPCIAVTWGFHSEEMLRNEKPIICVHTPQELLHSIVTERV